MYEPVRQKGISQKTNVQFRIVGFINILPPLKELYIFKLNQIDNIYIKVNWIFKF